MTIAQGTDLKLVMYIPEKFDRCRPQIEAKIAARSRPQEPQTRAPRLGPIWEQARQTAEALKTPEGKARVEHARWVAENKALVREAAARVRSARKP